MAGGDVEKIKDRLSINDVVGQYVKLTRAGRNFRGLCPFHKERTPSFMISPERGTYMCFGCGEKGDIFSFVQKIEGVDFPTALTQLAERAGVKLERSVGKAPQEKEKEERLKEVCEAATEYFMSQLKERADVLEYLHARGTKDETLGQWRVGYAPASWDALSHYLLGRGFSAADIIDAGLALRSEKKAGAAAEQEDRMYDRFRGRIMFPLFDQGGKVVAFSGRFFEKVPGSREEGEPAKYVNSPETALFKKSRLLYGFNFAKNHVRELNCFLLVEGQFDVIMSHQSGYPIAVAISGTALTEEHLSLLGRYSKNLILALDADPAGLRAGLRSAHMAYAAGFDVKVPSFAEGKDPADIAKENPELLKAAVRTSRTAIEYFLSALRAGARDERAYKKEVEAQVLPLIRALPSRIQQEHFARLVARSLEVSEAAVIGELNRSSARSTPTANDEQPLVSQVSLVPRERAAGMLIFAYAGEPEMAERLKSLLGEERYALYIEKLAPEAERLIFEFDSLGENRAEVSEELLHAIERSIIEDEMKSVRRELERQPGASGELLKRLSTLKMREQELRK